MSDRLLAELPNHSLVELPTDDPPVELEGASLAELENTPQGGLASTDIRPRPNSPRTQQCDYYAYDSPSTRDRFVPTQQNRQQSRLVPVTAQDMMPSPPQRAQPSLKPRVPSHDSGYERQVSDSSGTERVSSSNEGQPRVTSARHHSSHSTTARSNNAPPSLQQHRQRATGIRRLRKNSSIETAPEPCSESFFESRQARPSASARTPGGA